MKRPFFLVTLSLALWALYVSRAAPTLTIGDSGELAAVGATLGIGHSPGYPVFANLTSLGVHAIPWATAAYRVNILSALWTAASVGLVGYLITEITSSLTIGLLSGFVIGCGPLWMNQALVSEVFGLNSFFAALLIVLMMRPATLKNGALTAFVLGVGLGNHHTLILLTPACCYVYWPVLRSRPVESLGVFLFFALLGLSVYISIPIRAHRIPVMNWEEPQTWERFWKLFTRARYGSFQLAQGNLPTPTWADIPVQMRYILSVLWEDLGPGCLGIALAFNAFRSVDLRRRLLTLLLAFVFTGPFFFVWTHLHVTPQTRTLLDRFMYLPLIPAGILMGLGLGQLVRALNALRISPTATMMILSIAGFAWAESQSFPYERNNVYVRDLGMDLLRSCPPNTLLFADRADEAEFSLAYLQRAENKRRDVTFIDCNAGVSPSLYGPHYYDIWGRPRLALRTAEERTRIAQWPGPVYYATHEPEMIPIPRAQEGLLFAIRGRPPVRARIPWHELLIFRRPNPSSGRPASADRGMYWDYWNLLYRDSVKNHA